MPFPGGGTGSAQDLEAGEAAWVDQELIGASGSSFGDLPPAAGPSTSFDGGGINGGSTSRNVGATVVDPPAPEVKPVKRKKRGWKGWAVVTQDEHGNLIEVNDELPDGVRVKPIRAPASATIRVGAQSGAGEYLNNPHLEVYELMTTFCACSACVRFSSIRPTRNELPSCGNE